MVKKTTVSRNTKILVCAGKDLFNHPSRNEFICFTCSPVACTSHGGFSAFAKLGGNTALALVVSQPSRAKVQLNLFLDCLFILESTPRSSAPSQPVPLPSTRCSHLAQHCCRLLAVTNNLARLRRTSWTRRAATVAVSLRGERRVGWVPCAATLAGRKIAGHPSTVALGSAWRRWVVPRTPSSSRLVLLPPPLLRCGSIHAGSNSLPQID
jgi:hypothetical protein